MTEQELKKEIELIFEKYEEDFDLEAISEDFYNVIKREKQEGKKEGIEEVIKLLKQQIVTTPEKTPSVSVFQYNLILKKIINYLKKIEEKK
jgi:hypothetical protein